MQTIEIILIQKFYIQDKIKCQDKHSTKFNKTHQNGILYVSEWSFSEIRFLFNFVVPRERSYTINNVETNMTTIK